jgi:hypothetical protein
MNHLLNVAAMCVRGGELVVGSGAGSVKISIQQFTALLKDIYTHV